MNILIEALVAVFFCTCSSSDFDATFLSIPLSENVVIKSPGYPKINYTKNSYKKWHVNSYGLTENISININMDIYGYSASLCLDYLQIQEFSSSTGNSTIFKKCGKMEVNISSKEERLLIIFVSNSDDFTSKGFELILKGYSSIKEIAKTVNLSSSEVVVIKSPGYPNENYETGATYKWLVTAPRPTIEIFIQIKMDIHKPNYGRCEGYLKIEEVNPNSGNFPVFKQCGIQKVNRTAKGNRLLIKLVSNNDRLTSKGIELQFKVTKFLTTTSKSLTATATDWMSIKSSSLTSSSTTTKSKIMSTTTETSTEGPMTFISLTPNSYKATTDPSSFTSPRTTKRMTRLPTTETSTAMQRTVDSTSHVTTMDANIERHRTTVDISTSLDKSGATDIKETTMSFQYNASSSPTSDILLENKTVLVIVGLGVVELTLIIVGVLAAAKYRRRSTPLRQTDRNDDQLHTRQNGCRSTHVYDVIELDGYDEPIEDDKNPYKELPEGEYDKIFQKRPHVNNAEVQDSIYSKGAIVLNMFRRSSFFKRKTNETPPAITFSTFKDPDLS